MSSTVVFLMDVAIVVFVCVGAVLYVTKSLRLLLIELCGTVERAGFWLSFSNAALVLVPLICALEYRPDTEAGGNRIFEMAAQLRYGLIGFVITLVLLAIVLLGFIPRTKPSTQAGALPHS